MIRIRPTEIVFVLFLLVVAAFFRLYRLDQIPPGFQFDQAFYVFDVLRLLQGQFSIFFAAPGGTEPLYIYLAMVGTAFFGVTPLGLKLTSAVIAILTVPVLYGFARTVFASVRVAFIAAFLASVSLWHIFFSRFGERVTLLVLLELLALWFYWRALVKFERRDFALAGVFTAMALYTYPASRVFPIVLIVLAVYVAWANRQASKCFQGLVITFLVATTLFLPLGLYFVFHPDQFISHSAEVSIFVPHAEQQAPVPVALATNALRLLKMFFIEGDQGSLRNVPGRPIFDPLIAILFIAGVGALAASFFRPGTKEVVRRRGVLLLVWIGVTLSISLITDDAPNFVRTLPAMPAVMLLPAWGAAEILERLWSMAVRQVGFLALVGILAVSGWFSYHDYFVTLANDPGLYYTFNADKEEIAAWINQNAVKEHIFLAPVWYQVGTISLLTRDAPLKSFESRVTIILPDGSKGKDAVYIFPFDQERKLQTMQLRLGALGSVEQVNGSNGKRLFLMLRVPSQHLPQGEDWLGVLKDGSEFVHPHTITHALWGDQLELLGYSVDPEGPGGRNLAVTLFLRSLRPMTEDYSFSVKARDAQGRVWGQDDKWPGNNSYATTFWNPGDLVIERFYPGLDACAPAGNYRITLEVYNPKTMQVLDLADGSGNLIDLGQARAEAAASNRFEDLSPDRPARVQVASQLELFGFNLGDEVRPGQPFSFSLFWRGAGDGTVKARAQIHFQDASKRIFLLSERQIAVPPEGKGLCTLFDLAAPPDLSEGPGTILVNDVKIANMNVLR